MMRGRVLGLVLIAASLAVPAWASDVVVIKKYRPDGAGKVLAYDMSGKPIGKISVETLSPVDSPVIEIDPKTRRVKVGAENGPVWLLPIQVETSARAQISTDCTFIKKINLGQNSKSSAAGTSHVTRGLGDGGC